MEENKRTEEELEQTAPSAETPDEQTAEEQTTPAAEQPVEEAAPAEDGETPAQEAAPAEDGEAAAQEAAPAEDGETPAQEAAPAENAETPAQEAAPAAEAVEQKPEKKLTPGKLALIIAAIVVPGPCKLLGVTGRKDDYVIPWSCVKKVGPDIILVDIKPCDCRVPRPKGKFPL